MNSSVPDFLSIEETFSEDERLLMNSVRSFVDQHVRPDIANHFENATFSDSLVPIMGELGLLGAMIPEKYGGSGSSSLQYGILCRELERGDSGVRSFCSVQSSLVMFPIWKYGSEEQKLRWLPLLAKGKAIGCFGLTEPDFGSNPSGMLTRARKKGTSYILNGTKRWITNGDISDICVVWAKSEEDGTIGGYLVEKGAKGFIQLEMKHKLSLRASHTGELIFEDLEIPEENKLPLATGLRAPFSCLESARFGIIWGALGAAEDCYQVALDYAKNRVQFSKPIAAYQLVQAKLVNMLSEITKGQLLALQIARLRDSGKGNFEQISLGKMNNVRIALSAAREARDILGANGISGEYSIMRHMANLESVVTYEGTEDIHRLILGKAITGYSAFE
ncbi:MAG TPA: acyl-CoA dehydrogenase family protein [Oligoflexia bacterium]|nr:acyl-CoA dehydrogenase family protein [Oligoflexia bacterium]HMP47127.1 acyl-CoA dehydrogenase family protein [Oligoflexia bacterium]